MLFTEARSKSPHTSSLPVFEDKLTPHHGDPRMRIPDDEWTKKALEAQDRTSQVEYTLPEYIHEIARREKVPPYLFEAICRVESSLNPWAVRFEPAYRYLHFPREWASKLKITQVTEETLQKCSWGLGQVMGAVARELGFEDALPRLLEPDIGLTYAARHLRGYYERYGGEMEAVSSYNQGSPRKTRGGMFQNQSYVDKVYKVYREITPMKDLH